MNFEMIKEIREIGINTSTNTNSNDKKQFFFIKKNYKDEFNLYKTSLRKEYNYYRNYCSTFMSDTVIGAIEKAIIINNRELDFIEKNIYNLKDILKDLIDSSFPLTSFNYYVKYNEIHKLFEIRAFYSPYIFNDGEYTEDGINYECYSSPIIAIKESIKSFEIKRDIIEKGINDMTKMKNKYS